MKIYLHLLFCFIVAAIWLGILRQHLHTEKLFRRATVVLNPLNTMQLEDSHKEMAAEIQIGAEDYPSQQSEDYAARSVDVAHLLDTIQKDISGFDEAAYWSCYSDFYEKLKKMTDADIQFERSMAPLFSSDIDNKEAGGVLFRNNKEMVLNDFLLKNQLAQLNANYYFFTKVSGIGCFSFGPWLPQLYPSSIYGQVHKKIEGGVMVTGYRRAKKITFQFSSEGLKKEKDGIIILDTVYAKPGIQRIPFYVEFREWSTDALMQFHDTLVFNVFPK